MKPEGANALCSPGGKVRGCWRQHWRGPTAMTLWRMKQRHTAILGDLPGQLDQVLSEIRLNFSHVVSQHILFIVRASFESGFRALAVETPFLLALKWYEFKNCFPLLKKENIFKSQMKQSFTTLVIRARLFMVSSDKLPRAPTRWQNWAGSTRVSKIFIRNSLPSGRATQDH